MADYLLEIHRLDQVEFALLSTIEEQAPQIYPWGDCKRNQTDSYGERKGLEHNSVDTILVEYCRANETDSSPEICIIPASPLRGYAGLMKLPEFATVDQPFDYRWYRHVERTC